MLPVFRRTCLLTWNASLEIDNTLRPDRKLAHFLHTGPLRALQSLCFGAERMHHTANVNPPAEMMRLNVTTFALPAIIATCADGRFWQPGDRPNVGQERGWIAASDRL